MTQSLDSPAVPSIGIFDSGVGGLSILRALRARLPDAAMVYVGDVAWAPYGDRPASEVIARCLAVVAWLAEQGATMVVVACNTATVLAIEALRARWPTLVFIGVEPGVKPAAARSRSRRIAVMSTPATAVSDRLRHLIARYAADVHVHVQACHGLASAIERGVLGGEALEHVLRPHCDAIRAAEVDTVVLGCTHYPFVDNAIRAALGEGVTFIDTAEAVADRGAALWAQAAPVFDPSPRVRILSTGATDTMQRLTLSCVGLGEVRTARLAL